MSASTSSELHPPVAETPADLQHSNERGGRLRRGAAILARSDADEAAFWAHLEEREEGRVALEADHLFDTSYGWVD